MNHPTVRRMQSLVCLFFVDGLIGFIMCQLHSIGSGPIDWDPSSPPTLECLGPQAYSYYGFLICFVIMLTAFESGGWSINWSIDQEPAHLILPPFFFHALIGPNLETFQPHLWPKVYGGHNVVFVIDPSGWRLFCFDFRFSFDSIWGKYLNLGNPKNPKPANPKKPWIKKTLITLKSQTTLQNPKNLNPSKTLKTLQNPKTPTKPLKPYKTPQNT